MHSLQRVPFSAAVWPCVTVWQAPSWADLLVCSSLLNLISIFANGVCYVVVSTRAPLACVVTVAWLRVVVAQPCCCAGQSPLGLSFSVLLEYAVWLPRRLVECLNVGRVLHLTSFFPIRLTRWQHSWALRSSDSLVKTRTLFKGFWLLEPWMAATSAN